MSRRLVCTGVGEVAWSEIPSRELKEGEVRVRNRYGVEKHGTMLAFFKGYANERGRWDAENRVHRPEGELWSYPIPLGNMQVGEVIEGPGVGRTVYFGGAFQDESVVSDYRELPEGIDWRTAMLFDPAEFALGAVRDGHVRIGDDVAVFGLGAIGLVTVQMAALAGARVFALDPIASRREIALETGATEVLDPTDGDAGMKLRELTGMRGVDVAIDFSGSPRALQSALRGVGYGGTIVCGAFPPPFGAGLDFGGEAHMNRPKIVFSRACSDPNPDHPRWDWARIQETVAEYVAFGILDGSKNRISPPRPRARSAPQTVGGLPMSLKQSFCYPCFQSEGTSLADLFREAKSIGYAATELWGWDASLEELVEAAHTAGLEVASMSGHDSIDDGLNDLTQHERIEHELVRSIDKAAALGIPGVICFSGTRRKGVSDAEGLRHFIVGARRVTKYAEEKGINLNLEILNSRVDHPLYMADTVDWALAACEGVGSPRMKVLFDIYHVAIMEGDLIRRIRTAMPYIGHMHTAGNPGRHDMDDTQEINYRGIARALVDAGYQGYVGHELFTRKASKVEALRDAYNVFNL
ncbi:hypothetical protein EON81_04895 [bacterium]|nr:MAG: hypothetical protein EON81_04895 [bacterium]